MGRIKKTIIRFSPRVCLHLAWDGIPDYSYEYSKRNLDNSLALINMLVNETECRKIIVSGSCWEHGQSFFAWAKNALHAYGSFFCAWHKVDFIWLRIFFAFGPGQKRGSLIPTVYEAVNKGEKPGIKNPGNRQDFIYVGDVAQAFRLAVKKNMGPGTYKIGRGEMVSVGDVCRMVEKTMTGWRPGVTVRQGIKNYIASLEMA